MFKNKNTKNEKYRSSVSKFAIAMALSLPFAGVVANTSEVVVYAENSSGYAITKGGVTGTVVNVRTSPSTDATIHMKLEMGSEVNVIAQDGDFYRILVDGNPDLYIASEFIMLKTGMITLTGNNVNIRSGSSTEHKALTRATTGESFKTSGLEGDFHVIEYTHDGGKFAYIHKDFVSEVAYHNESIVEEKAAENVVITETTGTNVISTNQDSMSETQIVFNEQNEATKMTQYAVTTTEGLRLRKEPSLDAEIITNLPIGFAMSLTGENEEWLKVVANGIEGYIASEFASIQIEQHVYADVTDVDISKAKAIVEYGMKFLGTPYLYAGNDLEVGVDCSGFVNAVMTANDVKVSRNSTTLFYDGVEIGKSQLQMGDMVFFTTDHSGSKNNIAHVGIYIGNDEFIHSSSSERTWGVTISSLNEEYYINNYVSACRVL